jgi:hypothetical protein
VELRDQKDKLHHYISFDENGHSILNATIPASGFDCSTRLIAVSVSAVWVSKWFVMTPDLLELLICS